MSLNEFSKEELKQKSMLELASFLLQDSKKALEFKEIYDEIVKLKGFTVKQKENFIAQFYTELNVDGRFMTLGDNIWGLKEWYPVDKQEEEITAVSEKKSKKNKDEEEPKVAEDGFDAIEEDLDFDEELDEDFEAEPDEDEDLLDEDDDEDIDEDLDLEEEEEEEEE